MNSEIDEIKASRPASLSSAVKHQRTNTSIDFGYKRFIDLCLIILALPIVLPLCCLISLLIFLEDRGPIFFRQQRIGKSGVPFLVYKFRTMYVGAEEALVRHLQVDPKFREEWERNQKLTQDPRVTRMGKILRKTSLDEFPQLLNVLRGNMSLVGPRPIVASEIERYRDAFPIYCQTLPGLSGLWQVSGRNNTTYEERINLDVAYALGWSKKMEIKILFKTIQVLVTQHGAY